MAAAIGVTGKGTVVEGEERTTYGKKKAWAGKGDPDRQ